MRLLVAMLLASAATPAIAQDHSGHAMPGAQSPAQTECEKEAARHRAMGHAVPEGSCAPTAQPAEPAQDGHAAGHTGMDHSQMDHSQMDHGQMKGVDHSTMDHSKMEGMDHSSMGHENTQLPEQDSHGPQCDGARNNGHDTHPGRAASGCGRIGTASGRRCDLGCRYDASLAQCPAHRERRHERVLVPGRPR